MLMRLACVACRARGVVERERSAELAQAEREQLSLAQAPRASRVSQHRVPYITQDAP